MGTSGLAARGRVARSPEPGDHHVSVSTEVEEAWPLGMSSAAGDEKRVVEKTRSGRLSLVLVCQWHNLRWAAGPKTEDRALEMAHVYSNRHSPRS